MAEDKGFDISIRSLIKVVVVGLVLFFLWTIRDILILILIAVTLASALEPFVSKLNEKKIPRAVSVLSVYIIAILIIVFIGYSIIPPVLDEFKQLASGTTHFQNVFQSKLGQAGFTVQGSFSDTIANGVQTFLSQITNISGNFFQQTIGLFNGVIEIITILVISFYLVAEKDGMKSMVMTLTPAQYQPKVLDLVHKIQSKIGRWMIGQFILSASIFTLTLIGLTLLHVQYALVLAILAGIFELVPYIGPFISAIPAIFFAFLQSPALALGVAVMYVGIQKTEGYILVPKIMQKSVGLPPLVILIAILIGLKVAGIFGVFLAVPVVAAINVYIQERG